MKRTIAILIIALMLTALCVSDGLYLKSVFSCIQEKADAILIEMDKDKENIDTDQLNEMADDLLDYWQEKRNTMLCFMLHTQATFFTEKIEALRAHIKQNDYNMANTTAIVIKSGSETILDQNAVRARNIF